MRKEFLAGVLSLGVVSGMADDFKVNGDPSSPGGATWTYSDKEFKLAGVWLAPKGKGPFPVVLAAHGTGDNGVNYGRLVGREMVRWGYAVISPHFTHSSGVACGAPGRCAPGPDWGASEANVRRGLKTVQLLRGLPNADTGRVFLFGHSRGAFVVTALAAAAPASFRAAAHTAGGAAPDGLAVDVPGVLPRDAMARAIRAPYLLHHGGADRTVPLAMDERLDSLLEAAGTPRKLHVYRGFGHNDVALDARMFERTRAWFEGHRDAPR